MGLSTHVLDTSSGKPAAGMRIDFSEFDRGAWKLVKTVHTNADGRTDEPLLTAAAMRTGRFMLLFHVAAYFRERGDSLPEPPFLDTVPLHFGIADRAAHYHVPLLCTPWSYGTYRGS
ncbi:MAG TPA: hydroxyisourate hydrolase [Burkholderiaceae bacterium]|nr:hydroxyisourate hydrolase [Burkholderiaceae bacterium]